MRRSTAVTITLLSTAAIALVWCGDSPTPPEGDTLFTSEDACRASFGSDDSAACRDAFADARQRHEATAPRFTERATCETQTEGECTTVSQPGGPSLFMPVMAGVLIGRMLSNGAPRSVMPLYAGAQANCPPGAPPGAPPGQPGCAAPRPTSSTSSSSGGRGFYYSGGTYMGDADRSGASRSFNASPSGSTTLARGSSSTIGRGGLGSTGRGFSSSSS